MNNSPFENLSFSVELTKEDALAQLSQATGLSDQTLARGMPKFADYNDKVVLQKIGTSQIMVVLKRDTSTTYMIDDKGAIKPLDHDEARNPIAALGEGGNY